MKGRKPKPTKIHILEGGRKKTHRPLPKNEPKPDVPNKLPNAPKTLDAVGKKEWRRVGRELHKLGVLTELDLTAFEAYCATYSTWQEATERIQKTGVLIKAPSGYPIVSPYVSIANKAMIEMRKWLVEFGMTPSSRARVVVPNEKKESDPLEQYLNRGKDSASRK